VRSLLGSTLAPFRVRSFRYQWPADLATSWAFEMETLILGWYVLVETGSVLMLTIFASLQYIGTLIAPMFGVLGDRLGHRTVLSAMRAVYTVLAATVMVLAFTHILTPWHVLLISGLMGLVRPSDVGTRAAVVGDIMPSAQLMGAMSIQRTTQDSAKIAGALSGAGLVALLGMGPAYLVVTLFYGASSFFTYWAGRMQAAPARKRQPAEGATRPTPWRDLKEGLAYVWKTPHLLAVMTMALFLNMTAFPMMNHLLPVVAKQVYQADQTWLGYMVASASFGALVGSIVISRRGGALPPARMMTAFGVAWLAMLFVFSQIEQPVLGIFALMLAGCAQAMGLVPMLTMLLRTAEPQYRGRVMGIRMLAIYGNIPGLLAAGPLIAHFGYPVAATMICTFGIVTVVLVAFRWRKDLWSLDALANRRS